MSYVTVDDVYCVDIVDVEPPSLAIGIQYCIRLCVGVCVDRSKEGFDCVCAVDSVLT